MSPGTEIDKSILKRVLDYAREAKLIQEYRGAIEMVKQSFDAALVKAEQIYNQQDAVQAEAEAAWISISSASSAVLQHSLR